MAWFEARLFGRDTIVNFFFWVLFFALMQYLMKLSFSSALPAPHFASAQGCDGMPPHGFLSTSCTSRVSALQRSRNPHRA